MLEGVFLKLFLATSSQFQPLAPQHVLIWNYQEF